MVPILLLYRYIRRVYLLDVCTIPVRRRSDHQHSDRTTLSLGSSGAPTVAKSITAATDVHSIRRSRLASTALHRTSHLPLEFAWACLLCRIDKGVRWCTVYWYSRTVYAVSTSLYLRHDLRKSHAVRMAYCAFPWDRYAFPIYMSPLFPVKAVIGLVLV